MPFSALRLAALCAGLLAVCVGRPARANMAAPTVIPGYASRPAAAIATPLEVSEERLVFVCRESGCDLDATYVIENPTADRVETPVVFLTFDAARLAAWVDGSPAPTDLSPEERAALDATAGALASGRDLAPPRARLDLRLAVAPAGRCLVRVRGRVPLGRILYRHTLAYGAEAVAARHLVLGGRARGDTTFFDYLMSPINSWARVGVIHVVVEHPARWRFDADLEGGEGTYVWERATRGDTTVESTVTFGRGQERLRVRFFAPPPALENGGVVLGVGARLGDAGGFRARLGYEIAWDKWRLIGLAADTDFGDHLDVAATFELALPALLIFPSLGAGVGVLAQVRPEARAGVRGELSAMLYAVGVVAAFDWLPGADAPWRATLLARVSF